MLRNPPNYLKRFWCSTGVTPSVSQNAFLPTFISVLWETRIALCNVYTAALVRPCKLSIICWMKGSLLVNNLSTGACLFCSTAHKIWVALKMTTLSLSHSLGWWGHAAVPFYKHHPHWMKHKPEQHHGVSGQRSQVKALTCRPHVLITPFPHAMWKQDF